MGLRTSAQKAIGFWSGTAMIAEAISRAICFFVPHGSWRSQYRYFFQLDGMSVAKARQ